MAREQDKPLALLVNPPVYDFALYDLSRRGRLGFDIDQLTLRAGQHIVVAAGPRLRDPDAKGGLATELAAEQLGDVPLQGLTERRDPCDSQAVLSTTGGLHQPGAGEKPEVPGCHLGSCISCE